MSIEQSMNKVLARRGEVESRLTDAASMSPDELASLSRELSELRPVCEQIDLVRRLEGDRDAAVMLAEEAVALAKHVRDACPQLRFVGLMTIGAPGEMGCFDTLVDCRATVAEALGVEPTSLELSMGMSGDFEEAIKRGSDSVRVSSIFGARDYPPKQ